MLDTPSGRVPGLWPASFPLLANDKVREGLIVRSLSGAIEGRTTGARRPCLSLKCPGWFVTVRWESGQLMHICSKGWAYDPESESIRVVRGGEISARFVSPAPTGTPPSPREEWPSREVRNRWAGWR